jgi:hypothetical protein
VNLKRVRRIVLVVAVALLIVVFAIAPQGIPQNYLELLFGIDLLVWNVWVVMGFYRQYTANLPELPDDVQGRVNKYNRPRAIVAMFLVCVGLLPVVFPSVPIMVSIIAAFLLLVVLFWFFADIFWDTGCREVLKKSLAS